MSKLRYGLVCALGLICGCTTPVASRWVEQGPATILDGQTEGLPGNPVAGAINAIALDRHRPGTAYLATVNGGVWKSTGANTASPHWRPLTDLKLPALSINSIAISPLKSSVIFAGTGSTSSDGFEGSSGFGVIRSTNGGATWSILAASTFTGRRINSIVPTSITTGGLEGQVVLAATLFDRGGVYRSTDGGVTFTRISGTNGLPAAGVSNLVADPTNNTRFYAAVPSDWGGGAAAGVYRSDDGGVTWTPASTGLTGTGASVRILLSVGRPSGVVYAMVLTSAGKLAGNFRSTNAGATWTPLPPPPIDIFPGSQGIVHGAILADPASPNVVYVGGDRQSSPFPNALGCDNFSANVFRGDLAAAVTWQSVVCNGAQGTSPHADARNMTFDEHGNLLQVNDGGIYRLENPNLPTRRWVSLNGDIRPTEMHSAAFDAVSKVVVGGTQDTGTVMQNAPRDRTFTDFLQGDGGVVAVDDTSAGGASSTRYTSFQFLGAFNRSVWDPANNFVSLTLLGLQIVSGPGTGMTLFAFDPNIQFYNPYELNRINPRRMLIGTANIYESSDQGDHLNDLLPTGKLISSLSYGGRLGGAPNPGAFYVGTFGTASPRLLYRSADGAPIVPLAAYPGGGVADLVMDPNNTRHVYVLDEQNRVWASLDEGATWQNLTANLPMRTNQVRTIELFSPDATGHHNILLVGGLGGVFQMQHPGRPSAVWTRLGYNLPHGLVLDVRYNYTAKLLIAGILGRGAWTIRLDGHDGWHKSGAAAGETVALDDADEVQTAAPASAPLVMPATMPKAAPAYRSDKVQEVRATK